MYNYLPNEIVNPVNFPELDKVKTDIETINTYALKVHDALTAFDTGIYDRIYVDPAEVEFYARLCRNVAETMGTAPNVCFDVLYSLRKIQKTFNNILYLYREHGDFYVGVPTSVAEESELIL